MERDRLFNQIKEKQKENESLPAVTALSVSEYLKELKELNNSSLPHVLWQTRQWKPGNHPFFKEVERINREASSVIFVIDSSCEKDFTKKNGKVTGCNFKVVFTNPTHLPSPFNSVIGRNHMRIHILGETAYFSGMDFAQYVFDREELIYKVNDPELVQWFKIAALTDKSFSQPVKGYTIHRANGKESSPINETLRKKIQNLASSQIKTVLTITSSWIPDSIIDELMFLLKNNPNSKVNIIIRSPIEFESVSKLPFTLTKMIAYACLSLAKLIDLDSESKQRLRIFQAKKDFHAKFAAVAGDENYWWLIGTDNFTRFGYAARTSEIGLEGTDKNLYQNLLDYLSDIGVNLYD